MVMLLVLPAAVIGLATLATVSKEVEERWEWWRWALAERERTSKPILLVGYRVPWKSAIFGHPPNPDGPADRVLDLDPIVLTHPNGVQADVRDMPFADKGFSVCVIEHVAEHIVPRPAATTLPLCASRRRSSK